jgi:hypothetical protein
VPSCGSDTIVCSASRTSRWCSHAVAVTRPPPSVAHTLPDGAGPAAAPYDPERRPGLGLGIYPVPGWHLHVRAR